MKVSIRISLLLSVTAILSFMLQSNAFSFTSDKIKSPRLFKAIDDCKINEELSSLNQNQISKERAQTAYAANAPSMDVNNAMAREYTAFPGLYPTIATKLVNAAKKKPFKSKADVYAALDSDLEKERLRMYDSSITIKPVDKALQQFKGSQICKYECGSRVSNSYRDEQIKAVQNVRY